MIIVNGMRERRGGGETRGSAREANTEINTHL
jgi:hypothetical protein